MGQEIIVRKWAFATNEEAVSVLGPNDALLHLLDHAYEEAKVTTRGTEVSLSGKEEEVEAMYAILRAVTQLSQLGVHLSEGDYRYAIDLAKAGEINELVPLYTAEVATTYRGKVIRVKTLGQRRYVDAIRKNDIVFGVGPAGTGKTYLAVALAVMALKRGEVKRIVLTRPAVEAGENLGFLPGDLQEKVDPYCAPFTTRCTTSTVWSRCSVALNGEILRWRRWRTCADAPWTTHLSFWTKRRIPQPSK